MSLLVTGRPTRVHGVPREKHQVATLEKHTMYSVRCAPTEEPKPGRASGRGPQDYCMWGRLEQTGSLIRRTETIQQ